MAALTVSGVSAQVVCTWPWLIKKWTNVNASTSGGELAHGEGRTPDIVLTQLAQAAGTITTSEVSHTASDATNITLDCESNTAADYFHVYAIWFDHSSGGLTNVS
jgi:hypothetical protein